jgi:tetratricopeptide (TPR) repeat protein
VEARASRQAYVLTSPMVGRDAALAELDGWAAVLPEGRGGDLSGLPDLVHVTGAAGMGKTTLLREFRIHCQLAGISVGEGICREKPEMACEPVMKACRELLQSRGAAEALHGLGDDCRELVGELLSPEGGKHPEAGMEQFAERVSELLAAISCKHPLVLVFHDLHLADHGTLAVIGCLSRKIHYRRSVDEMFRTGPETEVPRILLCVSSRPAAGGGDGWQAKLGPDIHPTKMDLRPLTDSETADIVKGMFGSVTGEDMAGMLSGTCRGNPLHVVETLRAAVDAQVLVRRSGRWAIDSTAFASFRVPGSIADTLSQRAVALPDEQRHVVKMLALLGRPTELRLLAKISGADETSLQSHLEELHRKNIIACERSGDRLTYVVGHPAMARSLLERMSGEPERKRLHLCAAEAIQELEPAGEPRDEHVVWHLLAAGENTRAVETAPGAARWLVGNRASGTADELCMSVLGLAECAGVPRLNLLMVAAESLQLSGRLEEFFARMREAVVLAEELGMRDDQVSLALGYAGVISDLGRPADALAMIESAGKCISREDDPVTYARLLMETGTVLAFATKARLALEKMQEAESLLSQPELAAHSGLLGEVISWMGYVNISLANPVAAEEAFRRALPLLPPDEDGGEPRERTLRGLAAALDILGRNSEAAETFGRAAEFYRKAGNKAFEALCTGNRSLSELRAGRATMAEALLRSAIAMASESGHSLISFRCVESLCKLLDQKGRLTEPMCHLTRACERMPSRHGSYVHIRFHLLSARIKLLSGEYDGALKALSDIEAFVNPKENPTSRTRLLELRSSVLMAKGGVEEAVTLLKEASLLTPQGNMPARTKELCMQAEQSQYTGGSVDLAGLAKADVVGGWGGFRNKYVAARRFRERGDLGEASRLLDETHSMTEANGTRYDRAVVLIEQCKLANDLGLTGRADEVAAEADGLLGDVEIRETLVDHACAKGLTAVLRGLCSQRRARPPETSRIRGGGCRLLPARSRRSRGSGVSSAPQRFYRSTRAYARNFRSFGRREDSL